MSQNDLILMRTNGIRLDKDGQYWSPEDRAGLMQMFYGDIGISPGADKKLL